MFKDKGSFFEKLAGVINRDEEYSTDVAEGGDAEEGGDEWLKDGSDEGELSVDMSQTPSEIIIQAMIAGVKPENLDISINREMVTIKGHRQSEHEISEGDFFYKELYWGAFSRTILLPQEIEPEGAEASEKHGLLTIRLPKIDKGKVQSLKVKSR